MPASSGLVFCWLLCYVMDASVYSSTEEDLAKDARAKVGCPKERVDMLQKQADTQKDWVIPTNALVAGS